MKHVQLINIALYEDYSMSACKSLHLGTIYILCVALAPAMYTSVCFTMNMNSCIELFFFTSVVLLKLNLQTV